jgi:hypothetical protein
MSNHPKYTCTACGQEHDDLPALHSDCPDYYWSVPEEQRASNAFLTSESCVIDSQFFFIRGLIEIPVTAHTQKPVFGVWASLKQENFMLWQSHYAIAKRAHIGPIFGWLCTELRAYPSHTQLKAMVHMRDDGMRPLIELESTDHALALAQRNGII